MKRLLFHLFILNIFSVYSLTNVSGDVNGTWNLAGSPYHITGDTTIPVDQSLTIEAGVTVIFDANYDFDIRGQLLVNGLSGNEVIFEAALPATGWGGLYFIETITNAQPASVLNYCDISEGKTDNGGGIRCWYAELEVNNSTIHHNTASGDGGGVYASYSTLTFTDVDIQDNDAQRSGGFECHQDNTVTFTNVNIVDNEATNNTGGMAIDHYSTVVLTNVLVDNNTSHDYGGGLYIGDHSEVTFDTVTISNNNADIGYAGGMYLWSTVTLHSTDVVINNNSAGYGGGIVCYNNNASEIHGYSIHDNYANWHGGGIYCYYNSHADIRNSQIIDNEAGNCGGGVYCYESDPTLFSNDINDNIAGNNGGGIYGHESIFSLYDSEVNDNTAANFGGGIYVQSNSAPYLESSSILRNRATLGGGINIGFSSTITFDNISRCDLHTNIAGSGNDFYNTSGSLVNVYLDYSSVAVPDDYHAHPISNFNFSILHSINTQVATDLYVDSFHGSDANSGINSGSPLQTISKALTKIQADAANPRTIHLANGTYSYGFSGETYPLNCKDYVTISGSDKEHVQLNAGNDYTVFYLDGDEDVSIEGLSILNGSSVNGGGIYCTNSSTADFTDVNIRNNFASENGGGVYCYYSQVTFDNAYIYSNNSLLSGGGIANTAGSTLTMQNSTINSNTAENGAGIYCGGSNMDLDNANIFNNDASNYGGGFYIYMGDGMTHNLDSCVICDNTATQGSGFYIYVEMMPFAVNLVNCIVCDEITEFSPYKYDSFSATYSNVNGGCEGEGNIDVPPIFVDTANGNYRLQSSSDCIDAGNPDPAFNDPEDPASPGNALSPAMGTIRADMGSFGGPLAYNWIEQPAAPAEPEEGDIIITEICGDGVDGIDDDDGFVELFNNSSETLDLVNVIVYYYNNGFTTPTASVPLSNFSLDAGDYLIIAQNSAAFNNAYGVSADIANLNFLFDGGKDIIEVYLNPSKAGTIDVFNDLADPWSWVDTESLERNTAGSGSSASAWTANSGSSGSPGEGNDTPLSVTLSTFTAQMIDGTSTLMWSTSSETNNKGWNVYRAENDQYDLAIRINPNIIEGAGSSSTQTDYTFQDVSDLVNLQTYWYWLESIDNGNQSYLYNPISLFYEENEEPESPEIPIQYGLHQNYPNPFNPETLISFAIDHASEVTINIYNTKGQLVRTLLHDHIQKDKKYTILWDGSDNSNKPVSSGIYYCNLVADKYSEIKKMILIK